MMMLKMMMIVLMIPTIDKTDQQYQQHLTTLTTHHIAERWFKFNKKIILFVSNLFTIERKEREGNFFNASKCPMFSHLK